MQGFHTKSSTATAHALQKAWQRHAQGYLTASPVPCTYQLGPAFSGPWPIIRLRLLTFSLRANVIAP